MLKTMCKGKLDFCFFVHPPSSHPHLVLAGEDAAEPHRHIQMALLKQFCLIMGSDNLETFERWRNWEFILEHYQIYVYPRPGHTDCKLASHPNVTMVEVPQIDISSTYIREQIRQGHDVRYLLPEPVYQYLTEMHFYEKQ